MVPSSSDGSSISGPIDMEENITISDNKCVVAEFNAHSNKTLLQKTSVRISSPLLLPGDGNQLETIVGNGTSFSSNNKSFQLGRF